MDIFGGATEPLTFALTSIPKEPGVGVAEVVLVTVAIVSLVEAVTPEVTLVGVPRVALDVLIDAALLELEVAPRSGTAFSKVRAN